jgi:DNA-binding NarL/FixJ family response regulator
LTESRIRVLIADAHPSALAGVRASVEAGGFEVCGQAGSAPATVDLALRERPDLCLLDVHMPGDGIRAAREITRALPRCVLVMMSASGDDEDLFAALRAGAAGYLLRDTDPDRLPHALRGALAGEAAIPRQLVARLIDEFRTQGRRRRVAVRGQRGAELSRREWEVLDLMADGLSTAQIGRRLGVSSVTVRRHVSGILETLGVPDREAAVRLFGEARAGGPRPNQSRSVVERRERRVEPRR